MGFLDKAKEQAEKLAKQGQGKLDEVQSRKKADGLLRDLGAWYYAAQTDRDHGQGTVEMDRIVAELRAHEAEHGPLGGVDSASAGPGPEVHAVPTAPLPAPAGIVPPPPPPPAPSTSPGPSTEPTPPAPPAPPTAFPPPTAPAGSGGGFSVDDL